MRLKRFTIKNYKVIDDTEAVPVDQQVTHDVIPSYGNSEVVARWLRFLAFIMP